MNGTCRFDGTEMASGSQFSEWNTSRPEDPPRGSACVAEPGIPDGECRSVNPVDSTGPAGRAANRRQQLRDWHRAVLAVSAAILVLSLVLGVRDDGKVVVTGLAGLPLPETCGMRLLMHRDCPACGLTRSFIHLAHGDWQRSLAVHRIGWVLALALLVQFPYRCLALCDPSWTVSPRFAKVLGVFVVGVLIANWIYGGLQSQG